MTAMERVWTRMKTTATTNAEKRTLLTMPASRRTVLKICRKEKAKTPRQDALHYLATQLVRLTVAVHIGGFETPLVGSPTGPSRRLSGRFRALRQDLRRRPRLLRSGLRHG
jgi:hypothetical protein